MLFFGKLDIIEDLSKQSKGVGKTRCTASIGLLTLGWVLFSYLTGNTVGGWASIAALVLILGSLQLLMLGIFGEYLGRMYMESKHRSLFIVQEVRSRQNGVAMGNPVHRIQRQIRQTVNG